MKKTTQKLNTNQRARSRKAVKILNRSYERGQHLTNVVDMLTDLRHLCDVKNIDFYEADTRAYEHYQEEAAE